MQIIGYLQTSLIEWPGKVSGVIFVPGCNFRCPFCHNADLVDPEKVKNLPIIPEKEILADLKKRKKWIDGVVITGGEPLLQKDLSQFLSRLKQVGFETMLETNGSLFPILQCTLQEKLVDYVAMDYKIRFRDYKGVLGIMREDEKKRLVAEVKKSISLLLESNIPFELRTTVVPGIHNEETLIKMAKQLKLLAINYLPRRQAGQQSASLTWILQFFQPKNCLDPKFNKKKPFTETEMKRLLKLVKKYIPGAKLRMS